MQWPQPPLLFPKVYQPGRRRHLPELPVRCNATWRAFSNYLVSIPPPSFPQPPCTKGTPPEHVYVSDVKVNWKFQQTSHNSRATLEAEALAACVSKVFFHFPPCIRRLGWPICQDRKFLRKLFEELPLVANKYIHETQMQPTLIPPPLPNPSSLFAKANSREILFHLSPLSTRTMTAGSYWKLYIQFQ